MIDSYEPLTPAVVDAREVEDRVRRIGEEWDRHEAELHRLHPEIEAESRRGRLATPPRLQRQ